MISTYDILDFKLESDLFNNISGQADKVTITDLVNQYKLINEEVQETCEALFCNDPVGVLDGAIDTLYVTIGLLQKLESLGMDTKGAMHQVASDNLKKFPTKLKEAEDSLAMYTRQHIPVTITKNLAHEVYIIKDANDKIRKPEGFVSTNLLQYVPISLREGFKV